MKYQNFQNLKVKKSMKQKKLLAFEITKITRGENQAKEAMEISNNIFTENTLDDRINSFSVEAQRKFLISLSLCLMQLKNLN